jgi:hypothetical protein
MDSPSCHRALRRFWFHATRGLGVGVTAPTEEEARRLAEEALAQTQPGAQITGVVPDIDVSTLDAGHVLPNMGPAVVRGVWYPRLNL